MDIMDTVNPQPTTTTDSRWRIWPPLCDRVQPLLESQTLDDPVKLWQQLSDSLSDNPFAQSALDLAAYDLWGKKQGRPVYELWGLTTDHNPPTDYTIGIDEIDVMVAKMREFPGFPVYKIKLGTPNDLEIVRQLREHTDAIFRVDANCAWSVEETLTNRTGVEGN